ncbi:centrosomal protein of 95 kDa-like [Branchiostoma floridae]|uniref:Centrosomal protein of 95 kDa-like n=1 Tax=Branchiostoma floridae TaxID=7739 RepID=A0A9J7M786_BRAFL|nr:centrosomal protein of 95 kDa-like [Branchiostoma floridae]
MDSASSSSSASGGADEEWIELANSLLKKVHLLLRVRQLTDCDGHLLVSLYEGILGDKPPDCIVDPLTKEDHIHNVQSVIDSLALDYLHVNLSHITGEGVVSGDSESIRNLLEIFEGLFEYLAEEIESDSEQEDEGAPQDPYAFSQQGQSIITDVLDQELGTSHRTERPAPPATVSAAPVQDSLEEGSTDDLIELGDSRYVHTRSPVRPTATRLEDTYSKATTSQPTTVPSTVPSTSVSVQPPPTTNITPSAIPTPILPTTRPEDTSDLRRISTVPPSIAIPISVTRTPTHRDVGDINTTLPSRRIPTYSNAVEPPLVPITSTRPTKEPQPYVGELSQGLGVTQPLIGEERLVGQREELESQSAIRTHRDAERDQTAPKRVHFTDGTGRTPTRKTAGMDRRRDGEEEERRMEEEEEVLDHQRRLRQLEEFLERSREEVRRLMVREDEELSQHSDSAVDYETDTSSGVMFSIFLSEEVRRLMVRENEELSQHSDSAVDYETDTSSSVEEVRRLMVREDDELSQHSDSAVDYETDTDTSGETDTSSGVEEVRQLMVREDEELSQHSDSAILGSIYRDEFKGIATSELRKQAEIRRKSNQKDKIYRKATLKSPKKTTYRPGTKYRAPVSRGTSRLADEGNERRRKRSRSASPTTPVRADDTLTVKDNDLLPVLMEEFPFLHVSPHTMANMWRRQMKQIEQITKMSEPVSKRTKTQKQFEDAKKRQETMLKILDKERQHQQRMKELRDRSKQQRQVHRAVQQKRQQSARARRYYDEYQVRMRAKMLKRKTREEQIFKKLFEEGLGIQKTRIRDLRQYAKEKRDHVAQRQQDELESMENYYRDQFSMLAETLTRERYELQIRDKAQAKVLEKMRRELRQKMEQEIKGLQEQLTRDEDDAYFRQLEADRLRRQLNFARYQTRL